MKTQLPNKGFYLRHCGLSRDEERQMLDALGFEKLESLVGVLPPEIVCDECPDVGPALSELEALAAMRDFARQNTVTVNMIGQGYYGAEMPTVVRRNLLESTAWYTAYTPYQAEISQGRLEMLFNFQTLVVDLTGLPMSNASLLDEATAAAEAMTMLHRESKSKSSRFLVDESLFPQTLAVLRTRAEPLGIEIVAKSPAAFAQESDAFGALMGYPGGDGEVGDWTATVAALKEKNIGAAAATDLLALTLIRPPGEMGFDIAIGCAQRFGLSMGFGGPHPGFIACADKYRRHIPGRVVGVSRDDKGRAGFRLSLQAREQHIRREKATSNICTAQALPAMLAVAFAIYHGPIRLTAIANRIHNLAATLAAGLKKIGRTLKNENYFDTLRVIAPDADVVAMRALVEGINLLSLPGEIGISVDEKTQPENIAAVLRAFGVDKDAADESIAGEAGIPDSLRRQTPFCAHPVFNSHHTEHEMLRYLRRLSDKDISLNRSMIPLGSCTMKLNAATEMEPISWSEMADIHPFAPPIQSVGYQKLVADLERLLSVLTGFSAVSLQPNAGAQGEYAGLLTIRAYLKSIGQGHRNVCLIPNSAHGTNPASAAMAGMKIVRLEVDDTGQISIDSLREKIEQHEGELAAMMVTYPSTCGVFGKSITAICGMVHAAGGQVYMDGANFNALVGLSLPGQFGADVMHINLHKTFCIPHGGGGPGMGPIGVAKHLVPFLPRHPVLLHSDKSCGTVSAAPFGSPLILIISWMYIRMMGTVGLRHATLTALLSANYIAHRLAQKFPVVYRGDDGRVAHECIVDTRQFKDAEVSVEDIAKRLMDFGFHAPTVSWPLPGAIMIEPTESESKEEIDRFCDALLTIESEVQKIRDGDWTTTDNPLKNAPHPAEDLLTDDWTHPYSRATAAYPAAWVKNSKYWTPVGRIDAAWGDRNLVCSCPPVEDYDE